MGLDTRIFSHTDQPPVGALLPASARDDESLWLFVGMTRKPQVVAERKIWECIHSRSACIVLIIALRHSVV